MDENEIYFVGGETLRYSAENAMKHIYVTDRRVIFITKHGKGLGETKFKDVSISHISSIEWNRSSSIIFIGIGILIVALSLALMMIQLFATNIIPTLIMASGSILCVISMFYKKSTLILITANGKISFDFVGFDAGKYTHEITKMIRYEREK